MPTLGDVRRRALAALRPPPRLALSTWIEQHVHLPEGVSALPGPVRLWPYQAAIADAIGDPTIERVTLVKPVRVGFTTLLTGAVASFVANDPAPILALLPTESDCRDYVVSDLEPIFSASPTMRGLLEADTDESARNTLASRRFPGGSLKIVASRAPRNLRRHTARVLLVDEADAMEPGPEGSPILLAERRTLSFPDRKLVLGSTPLHEDTSNVLRSYAASDQRVYELPCPVCGAFAELLWLNIEWWPGQPESAAFRCPSCRALVSESAKPGMVGAGRWRATRPDVVGHAGFRLNALVSLLANASWGKLAAEFLRVKDDSDELQTFTNTILAQGWRDAAVEVDEAALAARVEPFGLDAIPEDVLLVTVGVDVQDDRLEATVVGWSRTDAFVLAHVVIWGSPDDDPTWMELDELLRTRWKHPAGGTLRVDAAVVDSGDRTDKVYAFCFPRLGRRIWAGKGIAGSRPALQMSHSKVKGGRLFLIGVDTIKSSLFDRLARGTGIRFSHTLEAAYFEQVASERKVVRYTRGQPVRRFERIPGRAAEALDALVYAHAARAGLQVSLDVREAELQAATPPVAPPTTIPSPFVQAW
jgi:phage terminase large subunit GpA-like protein